MTSSPPAGPSLEARRRQATRGILALQDASFRWGYSGKQALEQPETLHYSPNFRSTLWTLVLLADLEAPAGLPQVEASLRLVTGHFFDPQNGLFRLPGGSHFPIPCLNGNMLHLHACLGDPRSAQVERTVAFFAVHQRFDDGGFKTPSSHPYLSNTSCYGAHTCYWGVTKLLKGLSFLPPAARSGEAQRLLGNCIEFVLHHQVCFSSRRPEKLLNADIARLAFPCFYKSDLLELLWLLAREGVRDPRTHRAVALLRSRLQPGGSLCQDKDQNTVVPLGRKGHPSPFLAARARQVLEFFG